jgi:hypothetical protein
MDRDPRRRLEGVRMRSKMRSMVVAALALTPLLAKDNAPAKRLDEANQYMLLLEE